MLSLVMVLSKECGIVVLTIQIRWMFVTRIELCRETLAKVISMKDIGFKLSKKERVFCIRHEFIVCEIF